MNETISAIATANGIGSIAIVRISGENANSIIKILINNKNLLPRNASLCNIYDDKKELIDEAIVIYFQSPNSFTGEDIIEIQCHGGFIVAQSILKATIKAGARLAEAGEFSKRAFHNGKIDLSEAEAIAQLIEAKSENALKILAGQIKGSLSKYIESNRDSIIEILAYSEVSIDYAEEDLPEDIIVQIQDKLKLVEKSLKSTLLASKAREGLMQGFKVAIIGKPNVGKSSLLNMLLSYDRAIVSPIAGTTRDTIQEQIKIGTHLINIVDTAGIRETTDEIEKIGISKTIETIEQSDIILVLFDSSREFDEEDYKILSLIKKYNSNKIIRFIKNKIDLNNRFYCDNIDFDLELNSKENIDILVELLEEIMNKTAHLDEPMLISQRQINAVETTLKNIKESFAPLKNQELEIFSFHLGLAIKSISSITRTFDNDEMLDKMFSSFCLGK